MLLKGKTAMLKICGNCRYASRKLEPMEIRLLTKRVHLNQRYSTNLTLPRICSSLLRDAEVFCRRENVNVGLLD